MSPSRQSARTLSDSIRVPVLSCGVTYSTIACMTLGMPAITMTLPIQKPGAADTLLRTSSPPSGTRVMRMRASFMTPPVEATRSRMIVQRHAESLGDAIGGNVVMGRADAAGREHVSVARAERVQCRDDLRLLVGNDPDFLEIDADAGEIFGNEA